MQKIIFLSPSDVSLADKYLYLKDVVDAEIFQYDEWFWQEIRGLLVSALIQDQFFCCLWYHCKALHLIS